MLQEETIARGAALIDTYKKEMAKRIVGQEEMINGLLAALVAGGHILLEGVPGLAKTLAVRSLAEITGLAFKRIQFTPDLLPADLTGTLIWEQSKGSFSVRHGPVFANVILADEINRAPAKVQSALLEAMQEKQVTIGENSYGLPQPFLVLATQNPLEQEGTYPLREAQVDRFMLKVIVGYPSKQEERQIIRQNTGAEKDATIRPVATLDEIKNARELVEKIYMDEKIEKYILDIVFATRYPEEYRLDKLKSFISYGGSPRASINLALAGKAHAFMQQRGYVIPEDIKAISKDVLRHRIGITYEAEAENITSENIIDDILKTIQVP